LRTSSSTFYGATQDFVVVVATSAANDRIHCWDQFHFLHIFRLCYFTSCPDSSAPLMNDDLFPDLLAAVDQQLASRQTPYVAKTLTRLIQLGIGESEAKSQIALTLGEEMDKLLRTRRPFDEKSYRIALAALPMETDDTSQDEK
jgi:hypothetical protein